MAFHILTSPQCALTAQLSAHAEALSLLWERASAIIWYPSSRGSRFGVRVASLVFQVYKCPIHLVWLISYLPTIVQSKCMEVSQPVIKAISKKVCSMQALTTLLLLSLLMVCQPRNNIVSFRTRMRDFFCAFSRTCDRLPVF